jgi:hypothetical protein
MAAIIRVAAGAERRDEEAGHERRPRGGDAEEGHAQPKTAGSLIDEVFA